MLLRFIKLAVMLSRDPDQYYIFQVVQLNFACREPIVVLVSIHGCFLISKMPKASKRESMEFSYTRTNPKIKEVLTRNTIKRKYTLKQRQLPIYSCLEAFSITLSLCMCVSLCDLHLYMVYAHIYMHQYIGDIRYSALSLSNFLLETVFLNEPRAWLVASILQQSHCLCLVLPELHLDYRHIYICTVIPSISLWVLGIFTHILILTQQVLLSGELSPQPSSYIF